MTGFNVDFDLTHCNYELQANYTLTSRARRDKEETNLDTISQLLSRLSLEAPPRERSVSLDTLKNIQHFTYTYQHFLQKQYGCYECGLVIVALMKSLPFGPYSAVGQLQNAVRVRIDTYKEGIRELSERHLDTSNQYQEPLSLLFCTRALRSTDSIVHEEDWYKSQVAALQSRVSTHLRTCQKEMPDRATVIETLVNMKDLDHDLQWLKNTAIHVQPRFSLYLYESLSKMAELDRLVRFIRTLYGNDDLLQDFLAITRYTNPQVYERLKQLVPAAPKKNPELPEPKPGKKCPLSDHSFDQLLPENFDDPAFLEALPKVCREAYPGWPEIEASKILQRVRQLQAVNSVSCLTRTELVKLAYFLEVKFARPLYVFYNKSPNLLPRSLFMNHEPREAFVALKRDHVEPIAQTSIKKVTKAIQVPCDSSKHAQVVVQTAFRKSINSQIAEQEVDRWRSLQLDPGIWPLLFSTSYKKGKTDREPLSYTCFSPLAAGDLLSYSPETASFLLLAKGLIQGVHSMHSKGYVHGDLKDQNSLYNGALIGLIDFGMSFRARNEPSSVMFDWGYYGTIFCTPPEVFGIQQFQDNFYKADIWAIGFILYCKVMKQDPPWVPILWHFYLKGHKKLVPLYAREAVMALIRTHIEEPFKNLQEIAKSRALTQEESLHHLIFNMMRLDPSERYDSTQALAQVLNIQRIGASKI